LTWHPDDGTGSTMEDMNGSIDGMDMSHDSNRLHRADSNYSINSTVSADSRDHKFPKTSK